MKRILLLLVGLVATSANAWECEHQRLIEETLDVADAHELAVIAAAGDLRINGREDRSDVAVRATVCASKQEWVDESSIDLQTGEAAQVAVVIPEIDWSLSWSGQRYLYIDLEIDVPADLPLSIMDSSGDVRIDGTASVSIRDSSGDIEIENLSGDLVLEDSSGDIELQDIHGNVTVEHDSSGDIYGSNIEGGVLVVKDSSGDIRFKQVRDDFVVERDSSGDIVARGVGGDFRVLRDGSGDISSTDVAGEVVVPDKG